MQRRNGNLLKCLLCVSDNAPFLSPPLHPESFLKPHHASHLPRHPFSSFIPVGARAFGSQPGTIVARSSPKSSIRWIRWRISRKSPRASGSTRRRCLPPTRRVLLNHGQPREERGTNKGLLYLHRGFERWPGHVCFLTVATDDSDARILFQP